MIVIPLEEIDVETLTKALDSNSLDLCAGTYSLQERLEQLVLSKEGATLD